LLRKARAGVVVKQLLAGKAFKSIPTQLVSLDFSQETK